MDDIISKIIDIEWEFFSQVNNEGGKASCQSRPQTFTVMRKSQFMTWGREVLESYYQDLIDAKESGRNLLTEKYGRMMAWTHPDEYKERIEPQLPKVWPAALELVDKIAPILLAWHQEYQEKYPRLAAKGRPVGSKGDADKTAFEPYLRGELLTYSPSTLNLYAAHILKMKEQGLNLSIKAMENTARLYGYESIEKAEANA